VTDDLAHLTQQLRSATRELAPTQPAASTKLRSALEGLDENDLNTRMQRSSDWLRSGNFSDPLETGLTSDLQKLGQQVSDAARALGSAQRTSPDAALNRAMDDLSRLRDQLAGLGERSNSQPGGQQFQTGQLQRNGQSGPPGKQARNGQPGQQSGQAGGRQAGPVGNRVAGPTGNPGGGAANREGNVLGDFDTGNTRISGRAVAPQQGPNPADTQREIDQGLNMLNQVRAVVQDSPEARRELQALIDQMRNLDPSRFPGNPALVEQMHQQLVSSVDALELQLRRQLDENQSGTIRNADPTKVPPATRTRSPSFTANSQVEATRARFPPLPGNRIQAFSQVITMSASALGSGLSAYFRSPRPPGRPVVAVRSAGHMDVTSLHVEGAEIKLPRYSVIVQVVRTRAAAYRRPPSAIRATHLQV
jgi:hypothetical protein